MVDTAGEKRTFSADGLFTPPPLFRYAPNRCPPRDVSTNGFRRMDEQKQGVLNAPGRIKFYIMCNRLYYINIVVVSLALSSSYACFADGLRFGLVAGAVVRDARLPRSISCSASPGQPSQRPGVAEHRPGEHDGPNLGGRCSARRPSHGSDRLRLRWWAKAFFGVFGDATIPMEATPG